MALSVACLWGNAYAAEGGKSLYLLGKRGPLAGLIPKPGWYLSNDVYVYSGGTSQEPGGGRWRIVTSAVITIPYLRWQRARPGLYG